jgi:hypothetical protein
MTMDNEKVMGEWKRGMLVRYRPTGETFELGAVNAEVRTAILVSTLEDASGQTLRRESRPVPLSDLERVDAEAEGAPRIERRAS